MTSTTTTSIFHTIQDVALDENPSWKDILLLVFIAAVFWGVIITTGTRLLAYVVAGQPWLVRAAERDYYATGKKMHEDIGEPKTLEEFIISFSRMWPWLQMIFVQHFIGGLLCVPSVFGLLPENPGLANSLACLAIISEAGWELEDTIGWVWKRYFTKTGVADTSFALIIILLIHHSLATCVGLPMVYLYRDSKFVHWLTFDLQVAAGFCGLVVEYTKLLDLSTPNQLFQFKVFSGLGLLVAIWTRGFHWVYLCYQVLSSLANEENWVVFAEAALIAFVFSGFNYMFVIAPFYKRFMKFLYVSAKYESLPADSTPEQRRSSVWEMQQAAVDLQSHEASTELTNLFLPQDEASNRRASMPLERGRIGRSSFSQIVRRRTSVGKAPFLRKSFVESLEGIKEE